MPDTREVVRALVSAFNVNNHFSNTVETNFTLQSRYGKDCIVVSFDKGMNENQCREYLNNIKGRVVGEFYGIRKEDTDEVVLNTASLIFNIESFPFNDYKDVKSFPLNNYKGYGFVDKQGGIEFVTPVDKGVIFNLKSHLASSLKKDVLEDMRVGSTTIESNKEGYLWHDEFDNEELCQQFKSMFLSRMKNRYGYGSFFKKPLKVEGNSVYIRDVFNDARFIDNVTRYIAWLECMHLEVNSGNNRRVKLFKDMIIRSLYQLTGIMLDGFICAPPLGRKEASVLVPVILDDRGARLLTHEEALKLNYAFNNVVLGDLNSKTQAKLSVNGSNVVYGIDFSNPYISHCVITKIMESAVINKDHELAIDPELVRALSPVQSPVRVPNGPSSGLTELSLPTQEFPSQSQGEELGGSSRQGYMGAPVLQVSLLDISGTSEEFPPRSHLSYTAVSYGVSRPSSSLQSVGAAQNVQAGTSVWDQPVDARSFQASSAGPSLWSQSGPSSWKGANKSGSAFTSTRGSYSSPPLLIPSRGSVSGSRLPGLSTSTRGSYSSPPLLIPSRGSVSGSRLPGLSTSTRGSYSSPPPSGDVLRSRPPTQLSSSEPSSSKGANEGMLAEVDYLVPWLGKQSPPQLIEPVPSCSFRQEPLQVLMVNESPLSGWGINNKLLPSNKLNDKEKELIKALLYTFNLTNYTFGGVYTNFFAKDEKIVSLLHDNVDRKKYFQAVKDYIIQKYFEDKKEAEKVCYLNEFPFKLNYKEKQEKTVVANISSGALSNLKILFSQKFGKNVDAIDIGVVKEVEEREKDEWVDRQLSEDDSLKRSCENCFPDEGAMKIIPIAFDEEDAYVLNRNYDICEVRLLWKAQSQRAKGTSVAGKGKLEDNKDSDYSSGCVTDAEKVSSDDEPMDYQALSHVQQQNPCSDDEGNSSESSRSGSSNSSSKRALELSVEDLRMSTELDAAKVESPSKRIKQTF